MFQSRHGLAPHERIRDPLQGYSGHTPIITHLGQEAQGKHPIRHINARCLVDTTAAEFLMQELDDFLELNVGSVNSLGIFGAPSKALLRVVVRTYFRNWERQKLSQIEGLEACIAQVEVQSAADVTVQRKLA
ncbi:hypothetical protein NDU88_009457 [Pleurodeles waltl]|uniref:Uncharacterized protein n=1 Tax=Pleurodeles waltl TaxID=8319 RepID=A0AAV7QRM9_PLEWA|nr:hypothetical protein NDU88_009457 [Pleurodeles waltl]